ncbi:hypothetical protein P5673_018473 [Acropora cervicornis]|uniref:Uncharacterized protein n=1 Tax=Acropora cervicornis TaxID=6130 RepID=A0AAD9QDF3_ACRCE|nr:hypothetical protein P5673_018473 [Acropora cervicornis]
MWVKGETTQLLRLQPRRERRTRQMTLLRSVNAILKMRYVFPMLSHRLQCNLVLLLWIYQWGELPVRGPSIIIVYYSALRIAMGSASIASPEDFKLLSVCKVINTKACA